MLVYLQSKECAEHLFLKGCLDFCLELDANALRPSEFVRKHHNVFSDEDHENNVGGFF